MTRHDLKEIRNLGAELGAAKAENERLRKALKRIIDRCEAFVDDEAEMRTPSVEVLMGIAEDAIYTVHEADVALSQQPEPTDTFTAVDMATAAAQGFRDGQAAVEPAAAQDERELPEVVAWLNKETQSVTTHPVQVMDWDDESEPVESLMTVAQHERIVAALACPAQTEQQPVAWRRVVERLIANVEILDQRQRPMCRDCADRNGICESGLDCDIRALVKEARAMIAAPIAQTAPQGLRIVFDGPPGPEAGRFVEVEDTEGRSVNAGEWRERTDGLWELSLHATPHPEQSGKFAMHQRVRKTSGSEWQGRICGTYSTPLTPEGYAVESEAHAGSVQIYPAKALEAVE